MPELLRVRTGSPPQNIITHRSVSLNEIVKLFGSNPESYLRHQGPELLNFNKNKGVGNGGSEQRHVVIIVNEEETEPEMFPEAGCYVVQNGLS
jgi:hypothetical protein